MNTRDDLLNNDEICSLYEDDRIILVNAGGSPHRWMGIHKAM